MTHERIIYITKHGIKLGVSPEIGGMMLYLSKNNSENIVRSNPILYDSAVAVSPEILRDIVPFIGHATWLGPQSDWWQQQSVHEERKQQVATWPPDPTITEGAYTIRNKTNNSISLLSAESPIWGVQLQKDYVINPDGSIFISVTLIANKKTVAWDIWFNTRVHGFHDTYIYATPENIRTEHVISPQSTEMPSQYTHGFFHYTACEPPYTHLERNSKTFIYPQTPNIYMFSEKNALHITFEKHQKSELHPEQALVELYIHTEKNAEKSFLELEYHSPYKTIHPGETMSAWQVWNVHDYSGQKNSNEHIQFINSHLL